MKFRLFLILVALLSLVLIIYGIYMMDTYHSFPSLQGLFHQNIIIIFSVLAIILLTLFYVVYKLYTITYEQNKLYSKNQLYTEHLEEEIIKIEQQDESLELLFEKSSDGIMMLENGAITQCNEKAIEILTYESNMDLTMSHPLYGLGEIPIDGASIHAESIKKIFSIIRFGVLQFEWLYKKPNGDAIWFDVSFTPLFLKNHHIIHVVWKDITEKKKVQKVLRKKKKELYHQANHDALTGLTQRTFFVKKLDQGIKDTKKNGTKVAVLFIDLDQFKQINDSLGHDIGDKVLVIVSKRLQLKVRRSDVLCRFGGDEFTILSENIKEKKNALALASQILSVFSQPISIGKHTLYLSCSIGISLCPDDTNSATDLIKFADTAMYKAKEKGRNRCELYQKEMTAITKKRLQINMDMLKALKNEEFLVYYQPQIDARSGNLIGVEALVRWQSPDLGLQTPDKFLPWIEDKGIILSIDQVVMKKAMAQYKDWLNHGEHIGILSLNLTLSHLKDKNFLEDLIDAMAEYDFKAEWLELEVTENEVIDQYQEISQKLRHISDLGIGLAIDDFGTGYSSLMHLKKLPIDKLKIDQSFISGLPTNTEDKAIVEAIVALANALKIKLIAEGVETAEQKDYLLQCGCDNIQGYYYAKPMPAEQMKVYLEAKKIIRKALQG